MPRHAALALTPMLLAAFLLSWSRPSATQAPAVGADPARFPASGAGNISPDTHLVLTFRTAPAVGRTGQIRVMDAASRSVVDTIDVGVPPALQHDAIGGFAEGFHFYPVIVNGTTATVTLHHNVLSYGRSYTVQVDPGALTADGFSGLTDWTFRTRCLNTPGQHACH